MRLKLVPNHHFNAHLEASALRDNLGERGSQLGPPDPTCCPVHFWLNTRGPVAGEAPLTPTEEAALPLAVTKEAKVSSVPEELPEDPLGEEEPASLETA